MIQRLLKLPNRLNNVKLTTNEKARTKRAFSFKPSPPLKVVDCLYIDTMISESVVDCAVA
jgi:hypothetical protein